MKKTKDVVWSKDFFLINILVLQRISRIGMSKMKSLRILINQ